MNFEYYKIFYYVAKHKNITKAAAELYSSQPAITRALQNMEAELGSKLFIRKKTGVEFTREGKNLFEYVQVAFEQLTKAEEELQRASSAEGGTIYIGTTVTALHGFLFDFLDKFHLQYPSVKLKMITDTSDNTLEKLKNGSVDLAFVTTPFHISKPLVSRKLKPFRDVLIAGKYFTELKGGKLSLAELKEYPFICLAKGTQLRQFVEEIFLKEGLELKPDIEPDVADVLAPMASHNLGLAFTPEALARESLEKGEVFEVELQTPPPIRHICLITNPLHPQSNASRELCKMIDTISLH